MRYGMLTAFLACLTLLGPGSFAHAQNAGDAGIPESQIVEVAHEFVKNTVELSRLNNRQKLAAAHPAQPPAAPLNADRNLLKELSVLAEMYAKGVETPFKEAREEAARQTATLATRWEESRAELLRTQEKRLITRGTQSAAGQFGFLFSAQNKWFWLFGVLALLAPAGGALFERRHELRRAFNGGKGRSTLLVKLVAIACVVLACFAAIVFVAGDWIYMSTVVGVGHTTPLQKEIEATDKLAKEVQKQAAEAAKESQGTLYFRGLEGGAQQKLREAGTTLEDLLVELQVQNDINIKRAVDLSALAEFEKDIDAAQRDAQRVQASQAKFRVGLGVILLAGAAGLGYLVQSGMNKRAATIANTCPLCLTEGQLQPVNLGAPADEGRNQPEMVECLAPGCDFAFRSMYREMQKLCFPTLGITRTGKTHWLAEVYRQLKQGNYDKKIQFEKVKSASSEEFDRTVDSILSYRQGTASTQTGGKLPHPLIFNFLDKDWPVRSNTLVNIFDYGGEVTSGRTLDDYARRRALDADGYFYFLDPTLSVQEQSHALDMFKEDVAAIKGVKVGESLRCPVALIVPKIDLMVNQPYASRSGQDFITRFYRQLIDLDPTGTQVSLKLIEARSMLVGKLRDIVWPGWQIERLVDELFGGRYMFFPLTPVGMNEPGETDLNKRSINPYLILEPLLWMLHMNGYPVLK